MLAARYTRRDGLLTAVATPPLIFMIALVGQRGTYLACRNLRPYPDVVAEGTFLTLAAIAPWLFCGVILGLVIALFRGLPECVRDLRAELRVDREARSQDDGYSSRTVRAGDGGGGSW